MGIIRVLFLSDTHLGFDYPFRPRIKRRRRGDDFFRNYHAAIESARQQKVDLIIHCGDLFFRSKFPKELAELALLPLKKIADSGIPVYLLPGNHERSKIPYSFVGASPNLHIFHEPRTFYLKIMRTVIALSGFPFERHNVRQQFPDLLKKTGWYSAEADIKLLCLHQSIENSTVGVQNYRFRYNHDTIKAADLPRDASAILVGHIHRHQVLSEDLKGNPLPCPVLFSGSTERTSQAEREEPKGFLLLSWQTEDSSLSWEFVELPTRPMVMQEIVCENLNEELLRQELQDIFNTLDPDTVLTLRLRGELDEMCQQVIRAGNIRDMAPKTMNVDISLPDMYGRNFTPKNISKPPSPKQKVSLLDFTE